uniref:Short-chain dehydrogenase/reductase n=1 Tax=uncultured Chloroflexota bacterium TaxID=166587 RepID=H5S995_9CHLR|nr:short-chain dehydrogenase/reductase [uncultured Chloroflexota bacterium]
MVVPLEGRTILITGAARRIGRWMALACARAGADVILHHGHSPAEAEALAQEIAAAGRRAWILQADLSDERQVLALAERLKDFEGLYALVNNAAIFEPLSFLETTLEDWHRHLTIILTAPFLLSQAFACHLGRREGRIVNILDWRALRPGADHFPYTVAKAALAAMTRALAQSLAPHILVNGIAFGAILPPADNAPMKGVLAQTPISRLADPQEVAETLLFLLSGPAYITGEILHLDGGRHLT